MVIFCLPLDSSFQRLFQWRSSKVQAHPKAVSSLCVHHECLATGSSDSSVKIWKIGTGTLNLSSADDIFLTRTDEVVEVQSISLKGKYPLSIALSFLPQSESTRPNNSYSCVYLKAFPNRSYPCHCLYRPKHSNLDKVRWHSKSLSPFYEITLTLSLQFIKSAVLSGHDDWARCLAFRPSLQESEPLVLASGSHDTTIRLWNIEPYRRTTEKSSATSTDALSDELLDAFEASLGELADAEEGGRQISLKRHILTVKTSASR